MQAGIVSAAFAAGLLSFFSPCILPLLPVYIGLLSTDAGNRDLGAVRRAANTVAFVLGISTTFIILGLGAGAMGRALNSGYVAVACGIAIFLFGMHLSGFVSIPLLQREKRLDTSKLNAGTVIGAYLLGLGFSFGWTPCIGPILGSILALAAQQGTAAAGAALTLVYSLGMSIPFLTITLASNALAGRVRKLNRYLPAIQRAGGALIAIMGLWMVFSQVSNMVPGTLAPVAESEQAASAENAIFSGTSPEGTDPAGANAESADSAGSEGSGGQISETNRWRYMEMKDIDGQTHRIQYYVGKPVYIKFWGTWCPICMRELDDFAALAQEHNAAGDVQVVSVVAPGHSGEMSEDDFVKWAHEQGLEFPIFMDSTDELNQFFALSGYPTSMFVDSTGSVKLVRAGAIERAELEQILAELE